MPSTAPAGTYHAEATFDSGPLSGSLVRRDRIEVAP